MPHKKTITDRNLYKSALFLVIINYTLDIVTWINTQFILQIWFVCMHEYLLHFPVSYHSSYTHTSLPVRGRELPVPEGERERIEGERQVVHSRQEKCEGKRKL